MSNSTNSRRRFLQLAGGSAAIALAGCLGGDDDDSDDPDVIEPDSAPVTEVDRFSDEAGTLFQRSENPDLPDPDEPIDFDQGPFITQGLGPDGETVEYYNFDVMPTAAAPIYAFFYENGDPVEEQLNVIGVIPGDAGYNDFWHVNQVFVPDEYEPNSVTNVDDLNEADYEIEATGEIKNCPVIPEGSTAEKHYGDEHDEAPVIEGWYDDEIAPYFVFEEDTWLETGGEMPVSPIYVSFNTNPGQEGGGPPSGFVTEEGSEQTHNVVQTLPGDPGYSSLWAVNIYDNDDFDEVSDLDSAVEAEILEDDGPDVNCPIVAIE